MKKYVPWLVLGVFALEFLMALRPRPDKDFHFREFGQLPVLLNGRIQPLDSVARNSLLQIRSMQTVPLEEKKAYEFWKHPKKLKATEWLLELMTRPELADGRRVFLIHHPDLLSELKLENKGVERSGLHYFSFNELEPALKEIQDQGRRISEIESERRTPFEKQAYKLHNAMMLYFRLKASLQPPGTKDFAMELGEFRDKVPQVIAAVRAQPQTHDMNIPGLDSVSRYFQQFQTMDQFAYPLLVPSRNPEHTRDDWMNVGASLLESLRSGEVHPAVSFYATMASAYGQNKVAEFNQAVSSYRAWLSQKLQPELKKGRWEHFFNGLMPFYRAMLIYIVAFILGCIFWFNWSEALRRSALYLLLLAFGIHTFGLIFRMVLEGRPPVTNLYSSAVFIGWGAVLLGLILEKIYRDGIGIVTAAAIGFVTQLIAHNLALGGDTMEMLRAVLDTNFWLATHVVVITLGYASTFVAGFLAIVYILRGLFTATLSSTTAKSLTRMVYGIVCFATLFSFVGTVLGGIWADQSWGRFWGWDPKENGALIIVLWNAAVLHARWGGLVRERGLMNMVIFGNVVTAFSWFGVNMLGIGLHSYGFMDAAFFWLMLFVVSQVLIIALGMVPLRYWLSFKSAGNKDPESGSISPPTVPEPA
jgi:ABC-type transport system involved in cytochrome c biogenesis permease subunit